MHQLIKPAPKPDHPPCCIRVNSQIPIQTRTEYTATKYNHYRDIWSKLRPPLAFNKKWTLHPTVNYAHDPIAQPSEVDQEFFQYINNLYPAIRQNIGRIESITNIEELIQAFEDDNLIAVCDASVNSSQFAAHSYIIESKNEKDHIRGNAPVDCDEDDSESTRAEKSGVLALITIVEILENMSSCTAQSINIYCDNKESVTIWSQKSFLQSFNRFTTKNIDLDMEIRATISRCKVKVNLIHMHGHQDDDEDFDYDSATQQVRRNIDMDILDKSFLKHHPKLIRPHCMTPAYPAQKVSLKIHNAKTQLYLSYREAFSSDADVKTEVRHYYVKLKKHISLYHIRAHQDGKTKLSSLSTAAKLNTLMDRHAKDAILKHTKIKHRRLIPHLPRQKISIKSSYDRITNDLASNINKYKIGHECEKWLGSRWKLSEQQMTDIEWLDIKSVLANVKGLKRTQFIKIVHKWWATNKRQHVWNQVDSPNCPFCKTEIKARPHILQCQNIVAKSFRTQQLVELRKKLKRIETSPLLTNHIMRCLHKYHGGILCQKIQ